MKPIGTLRDAGRLGRQANLEGAAQARFGGGRRRDRRHSIGVLQLPSQAVDRAGRAVSLPIDLRNRRVKGGSLMSYGPSFPDMYRRSADYIERIGEPVTMDINAVRVRIVLVV